MIFSQDTPKNLFHTFKQITETKSIINLQEMTLKTKMLNFGEKYPNKIINFSYNILCIDHILHLQQQIVNVALFKTV